MIKEVSSIPVRNMGDTLTAKLLRDINDFIESGFAIAELYDDAYKERAAAGQMARKLAKENGCVAFVREGRIYITRGDE